VSEAWYEVGKWSIDANISPLLDKVLTEFTSRIDDELFQMLSQETICILDCATVSAAKGTYSLSAMVQGGPGSNELNYTNPITINGIVSVANVIGHIDQYSVMVDWGDGILDHIPNSSLNFVQTSPNSAIFNGTYQSPSHSYATTGTKHIVVSLYHRSPSGNDGFVAQQRSVTINVVYSIQATASSGGSISPEGYVQMFAGANQTFTISPDTGHQILDVLVDGASVGILTSYTFTSVGADHTINAIFGKINSLPVANPEVVTTDEDTSVTLSLTGSDADGDSLSYSIVSSPSNGVLTGTPPNITYTPDSNYKGSDAFTFKVNDGTADSNPATVSITINAVKDVALITLGGLHVTYNGLPKPVTVTTDPAGLAVTVTYDGSETAPTNAGSYVVVATITDPNYTGSLTGTMVIGQADATIELANLNPAYDGNPKPVTVTTDPAGLAVTVTYDGSETAPTNAGSYQVVATITDPNYTGSLTGTMVIGQANTTPTAAPEPEYFSVDFEGNITRVPMAANGALLVEINASNQEGTNWLEIPEGTIVKSSDGAIVKSVTVSETAMPGLNENKVSIGEAYSFEPSGASFSNPGIVTLGYNPNDVPQKITSVNLSYFESLSGWVDAQPSTGTVAEVGQVSGAVQHFSVMAVTGNKSPASFTITDLKITRAKQQYWGFVPFVIITGKQVLIEVDIRNQGGLGGTFNGVLTVDGQSMSGNDITIEAGQTGKLSFNVGDMKDGGHAVDVSGTTGQFATSLWINWWLIIAIVVVLLAAIIMTIRYLSKRRKNKAIAQAL